MDNFRERIVSLCKEHGHGRTGKRDGADVKKGTPHAQVKRRIQELEKTNDKLKRNLSSLQSTPAQNESEAKDESGAKSNDNAGNAFGGKSSMKKGG